MITIGSLFAGIGGIERGLECAGLGPVLWQVEIKPFSRAVLERHWPDVDRSVQDVTKAGAANLAPVELICGGFPCKGTSSAGQRRGLADPRSGLWYEFARILGEMRPKWAVVENVSSGAGRWVDQVQSDLRELGYASLPVQMEARDFGYPQIRSRYFFVACRRQGGLADPYRKRREAEPPARLHGQGALGHDPDRCRHPAPPPGRGDSKGWRAYERTGGPEPGVLRGSDGFSSELDLDRLRALGNAVMPPMAETLGWIIRELGVEDDAL